MPDLKFLIICLKLTKNIFLGNLKSREISLKRNPLALLNKYSRFDNLEPINCFLESKAIIKK